MIYDDVMELNEELDERQKFLESIGETEETLLEMANIGVVDGTIYIKVYGGEGPIPHFHFYETQSRRAGCLKILEASYSVHGRYLDDLKRDERRELVDWLRALDPEALEQGWKRTNWQAICYEWNKNNPQYKLENPNPPIPDYMKI